ncbi:MAG: hypothetical protein JWN24_3377 [Phycisphaerales bacterium]|nr:hypothetical protein [Phycisphaerales bacterium]
MKSAAPEQILSSKPNDRANSILDKQAQLNRSTRGQWGLYASHRQEIERLLVPPLRGGRICVLGAGNCNDIDLQWLAQVYREVHLVDIDGDALEAAAKRQEVEGSSNVQLHGGVDLTGVADLLGTWAQRPPTVEAVETCTRRAAGPPAEWAAEFGGAFDAVLSPCVLSQLITPVRDSIGEAHPGFAALLAAIRSRHLLTMVDLLAPGGRGVFVTDLLSSARYADLAKVAKEQLPGLMRTFVGDGKYFGGLDPGAIAGVLKNEPGLANRVGDLKAAAPWLWHLGLNKAYLVYAICFRRRGT